MENRNLLSRRTPVWMPLAIIFIGVLLRLVPHIPNVTPIGAMALFGGYYLPKRLALFLPLSILFVSDVFLGFHQSMPYVYMGFGITVLLGVMLRKQKSAPMVLCSSLTSSVIFFLITNFGFFLTESLYPKTLEGQIHAYYYALPFFRNSLIGDFFYTVLLFGGYELFLKMREGKRLQGSVS